MCCLFESEDDITLDHIWLLLTLLLKGDLVSILHTTFNFNSELLTFLHNSSTFAYFAVYCIDFALATTLCARLLHLHLHDAHIHKLHCYTFSFASWMTCYRGVRIRLVQIPEMQACRSYV